MNEIPKMFGRWDLSLHLHGSPHSPLLTLTLSPTCSLLLLTQCMSKAFGIRWSLLASQQTTYQCFLLGQRAVLTVLSHQPVTVFSVTVPVRYLQGKGGWPGCYITSVQDSDLMGVLLDGLCVQSHCHLGWCASHQ